MAFMWKLVPMLIFYPIPATVFLRFSGVPFPVTVGILLIATSASIVFLYYLWGTISGWITRWVRRRTQDYFASVVWHEAAIGILHLDFLYGRVRTWYQFLGNNRLTAWIARQRLMILFAILCIPVPYIPSVATMALRKVSGDGRKKGAILVLANFVRTVLMVLIVYWILGTPSIQMT